MCGIVAYIGHRKVLPLLVEGLLRLEYRGYDSAGVAILQHREIQVFKKAGKVSNLAASLPDVDGTTGIAHTRWATHGLPNDTNAHPHLSGNGRLALVHNGIIENYAGIRQVLQQRGHTFHSDTDTEVLVHLIEEMQEKYRLPLLEATRRALQQVHGAYAIVVVDRERPDTLVAARQSSPLVVGLGKGEYFVASDVSPMVEYTQGVIYLEDRRIISLTPGTPPFIITLENEPVDADVLEMKAEIATWEKQGYDHYMLKEIFEQPLSLKECMKGRLVDGQIFLSGIRDHLPRWLSARRMIILGCGTSWHAGLVAEYLFESLARLPVEVEYASEFRYRSPILRPDDIVLAISQSGETADTLAALELAKAAGAFTYGIVNSVGSSIARLTDAGSYIHVGPEIGVASTKAFTGQLTVLAMLALRLGLERKELQPSAYRDHCLALTRLPQQMEGLLAGCAEQVRQISAACAGFSNALYLGRGFNFPVALEGALKLKEISYIHAEGYPAAEMKHGPIALIDEHMPVFVIATNQSARDKIVSNIQEIKARKGQVIALVNEGDHEITALADHAIALPPIAEPFAPLLAIVPLQLLAYHVARLRGCDVDQPRNLAKSVTVE